MNRKYTKEEIKNVVNLLRENFAETIFTADIIVGFPGETEKEFEETYELLKETKLYKIHVFPYSKREGTRAAEFPDQVSSEIKEARSKKIIELSNKTKEEYNNTYINRKAKVLIEEKEGDVYKGHTANYLYVMVKSDKDIRNNIVDVQISEVKGEELIGELMGTG